jgi:hypothetical protein
MQNEYYFDIETVSKRKEDCKPECTANLSPETGKVATIQFQRLDTVTGSPIGSLTVLKEWKETEKGIIEKFKDLIGGHAFNFIPVGNNLSFDLSFLYAKLREYFPDIEFTPFYFWHERPHLDIKPILVILNNGSFLGAKLSRFTKKEDNGKFVSTWYHEEGETGKQKILDYIKKESEEFIKAYQILKKEIPTVKSKLSR